MTADVRLPVQRRWRKGMRGEAPHTAASLRARTIEDENGCWIWAGYIYPATGYGQVGYRYGTHRAHRLMWILTNGPIAEGLELDHLCRVRACINPAHLEPVTSAENKRRSPLVGRAKKPIAGIMSRARAAARTHCRNGHPIATNEWWTAGRRRCRACDRMAGAAYRRRNAA